MSTSQVNSGEKLSGAVVGWTIFAASIMVVAGIFDVLYGIAAIAKDKFFVVGPEYLYKFDVTTWGWIHLILGIIVVCAGAALFADATWARVVGMFMAGVSMIVNFAAIPYQPVWSITIIFLSVCVIWALSVSRSGKSM